MFLRQELSLFSQLSFNPPGCAFAHLFFIAPKLNKKKKQQRINNALILPPTLNIFFLKVFVNFDFRSSYQREKRILCVVTKNKTGEYEQVFPSGARGKKGRRRRGKQKKKFFFFHHLAFHFFKKGLSSSKRLFSSIQIIFCVCVCVCGWVGFFFLIVCFFYFIFGGGGETSKQYKRNKELWVLSLADCFLFCAHQFIFFFCISLVPPRPPPKNLFCAHQKENHRNALC